MAEKALEQDLVCPLRYVLDIVGGKWKFPIICLLSQNSVTRYSAIKRGVDGITNMMQSQSLKELEAVGIVTRKQYNEVPPRVEYALTPEGEALIPALEMLGHWGARLLHQNTDCRYKCKSCGPAPA